MSLDCIIIDDSLFVRETVSSMIIDAGHNVTATYEDGERFLQFVDNIDADNEKCVIDLTMLRGLKPNKWTMVVETVTGATALIDVNLTGYITDLTMAGVEIMNVTADDTYETFPDESAPAEHVNYHQIQLDCDTVGSGNTLRAHIYGSRV